MSIAGFDLGVINTSCCHIDIKSKKIIKWELIDIKDNTNEGSCKKMVEQLNNIDLQDSGDVIIVVEQQPRCNVKIIMISGFVHMYYTMKKMEDDKKQEQKNKGTITKIVGHHAKNKTKIYEKQKGEEEWPKRIDNLKAGHYKTKQIAIEQCRRILKQNNENEKWIDFFEKSPKRDDLADSYLMCLSYIKMYKL